MAGRRDARILKKKQGFETQDYWKNLKKRTCPNCGEFVLCNVSTVIVHGSMADGDSDNLKAEIVYPCRECLDDWPVWNVKPRDLFPRKTVTRIRLKRKVRQLTEEN